MNENIVKDDLHDTKHIRKSSLRKLIINIKSTTRKVLNQNRNNVHYTEGQTSSGGNLSPGKVVASNTDTSNNISSSSSLQDINLRTAQATGENGLHQSIVEKILHAIELGNKQMMSSMASNMKNILGGLSG